MLKRKDAGSSSNSSFEPEPELEPELVKQISDEDFEMVEIEGATPSHFHGSRSDHVTWIGFAAESSRKMTEWVTALLVPRVALTATRAGAQLDVAAFNSLMAQFGTPQRVDLAGEEFLGLTREAVKDLVEMIPQVCEDLTTLFVADSISRAHWDMLKDGLPQLQRIVRGATIDAHDGIVVQAGGAANRLDLTGPEYASTTFTGLVTLSAICANVESLFFVKDREITHSTFPRGPFCVCNPETGKMIRLKGNSLEAIYDEGQTWEYIPKKKHLVDKNTQLVLGMSENEVTMQVATRVEAQQWVFREEDSAIVNPGSGKALDIEGGAGGTRIINHTHHGRHNQKWTLMHDDDTGGHHNPQDTSQFSLTDDECDRLKKLWPKLRVVFLGREISASAFDRMMEQYRETRRIDLTGDEYANLTGLGMLELAELCPEPPTKLFLHSKHTIGSMHLTAVTRKLKLDADVIVVRDIKLSDCIRLNVKQAAEVDMTIVQTMVTPRSLPDQLELQEDILSRQSSRRACFRCDGGGLIRESRSAVTISFATLDAASDEVTCTWLYKDGAGAWCLYDKGTTAMLEREWRDAAAITDGQPPTVQLHAGDRVVFEVDMKAMTQMNVISGSVVEARRADEAFGEAGNPCWVCRGTGATTEYLQEFDSQLAEQEQECLICYDEAAFGLSTECGHFFCEGCIRRSLEAMMDTAQFPAFCPQCRVDANDASEELKVGRILPDALSFLEQRKVITKDFLFRFEKQNTADSNPADDQASDKYFGCPGKCGRFLIEEAVEFRTDKAHGIPVMRLGACPCGACICLQCKLEESTSAAVHQCPSQKGGAEIDAMSLALVAKAGKKCPKCKMFVQRTEGCHVMMCGTNAHGKVTDALRNGGCAHIFDWNTLLALNDGYGFTEMDGSKGRGNPVTARQVPAAPKCAKPGCPFLFHADVKDNGGKHCCTKCRDGGVGHAASCHRLRFEAPAVEGEASGGAAGGAGGSEGGFTVSHDTIELSMGGTLATKAPSEAQDSGKNKAEYQTTFSTEDIMGEVKFQTGKKKVTYKGKHSATFTIMSGTCVVGVANPEILQASEWRPGGSDGGATATDLGWGYLSIGGNFKHNNQLFDWKGQKGARQGDELTLLLDLDIGELWVALKKAAPDSEQVVLGQMASGLQGPLMWMAELCNEGAAVSIKKHTRTTQGAVLDPEPKEFLNLPRTEHELTVTVGKYRRDTKDVKFNVKVTSADTWMTAKRLVQDSTGIISEHFWLSGTVGKDSKSEMFAYDQNVGLHVPNDQRLSVTRNGKFDVAVAKKFLSVQEGETGLTKVVSSRDDLTECDKAAGSDDELLKDAQQALIGLAAVKSGTVTPAHTSLVALMISALPHVDQWDKYRSSAVMEAADNGHTALVSLLLAANADVELRDTGNRTALHWAAMRGHAEVISTNFDLSITSMYITLNLPIFCQIVELLLATVGRLGGVTWVSLWTRSKKGYTPMALARRAKHEEIAKRLRAIL